MPWTIEHNSLEKSLDQWGITSAVLSFRNQQSDQLVIAINQSISEAPDWDYDDTIILRRDRAWSGSAWTGGSIYFRGRIAEIPRSGTPSAEVATFTITGPWRDLEEIMFGQNWRHSGAGQLKTTHLLLNYDLSTSEQIQLAVQAAINSGASIQIGTIDTLTSVPVSEVRDLTCAEVIRQQLRWSPDVVVWFDYSTNPPTFHCRHWWNLTEVYASVWDNNITSLDIRPRYDLVLPGVLLNYELSEEVDGVPKLKLIQDKYPPSISGFERGCLVATFDLQGARIKHAISDITTAPINASNTTSDTRLSWWRRHCPELNDSRVVDLDISVANVKYYDADNNLITWSSYPNTNELISGEITPWMEADGITWERITIRATATFKVRDASSNTSYEAEKVLVVEIIATSAVTDTYVTIESVESAEPVPVGLAQFLYTIHSILHYEGECTFVQREISGSWRPGKRLNITGAQSEWQTMRAAIQQATEDLTSGVTHITFGPPTHLGPSDIVEWLRAFRTRRVWTNLLTQSTGQLGDENKVESAKATPIKNSALGNEVFARIVIRESSGGGYLDLNRADLGGKVLTIRELDYCDGGVLKKIKVVASAPYTP
jgi:hypothetical protein